MTQAFFDYRFASGHVSYATITGSSTYILRNFTRATDQPKDLEWYIAETPPIDDAAFFSGSLSGNTGGNGLPFIDLYLSGVTPGMVAYWNTTFL